MGIESDQLVFDYLSRVGDLAQQRQLSSADRMRLVAGLRAQIDERRAGAADTPAAVKRILGRLGTPSEVVAAAGTSGGPAGSATSAGSAGRGRPPDPDGPEVPVDGGPELPMPGGGSDADRAGDPESPAGRGRAARGAGPAASVPQPRSGAGASPPHLAGEAELGESDATPDWWRVDPSPFGNTGESVPGFVGGIEIPEILRPPQWDDDPLRKRDPDRQMGGPGADTRTGNGPGAAPAHAGADLDPGEGAAPVRGPGRLRRVLTRRRRTGQAPAAPPVVAGRPRTSYSPLLLLAAALLVAGAVLGSVVALAFGWLIAYGTRKLSRVEAKWAAMGLPGLVAAAAVTWLWGRLDGRWGEPIPQGHMAAALIQTWPIALRAAAVASALYLLWRARRG